MHDLEFVARPQFGHRPFRARQNRKVQFDRKPFRRQLKLFDQVRDARARIDLMRVAVDGYFDCVLPVHASDYPPPNRIEQESKRLRRHR